MEPVQRLPGKGRREVMMIAGKRREAVGVKTETARVMEKRDKVLVSCLHKHL